MVNKKRVALAAGGVAASKALPAVAIMGGGYLLYKALTGQSDNNQGGGSNNSFIERYVTNTIQEGATNTKTYLKETTPGQYWTGDKHASDNAEIYGPDSPYATAGGTADPNNVGTFDFLTKGPIGLLFGSVDYAGKKINPMPEDLKNTQKKLGSGNFSVNDIANPDNPINKFLGFGKPKGINVAGIESGPQAASMGLGLAPLAVNANPKPGPTVNPDKVQQSTQSLENKIKASGMPASNLNKGAVTGTEKDKTGVERIIIKYDNGVTMRY